MSQKPYLNAGAGRVILPASKPAHYGLIDDAVTSYALWVNADRNAEPGIDVVEDLFTYPWSFDDNSFDGILFSHFLEHCPHEIRIRCTYDQSADGDYEMRRANWEARANQLRGMQDGWYALLSEAWRVCTPGATLHILCPYAWSQGAVTDPSHTRLITEQTFSHSLQPDPNSPFAYATGGLNLELVEPARFTVTQLFAHLIPTPDDTPDVVTAKQQQFYNALQTRLNVVYELYVKLRVVK